MTTLIGALLLVVSLYVYGALARQLRNRPVVNSPADGKQFGPPEVVVALALVIFLGSSAWKQTAAGHFEIRTGMLVASLLFTIAIVVFLATFLKLRGFVLGEVTGMARVPFGRALITGLILLVLAYPLVYSVDWLVVKFGGAESSRQEIVELFSSSNSLSQRIVVILLAVVVAPMTEEFVFRFFLFKVVSRYGGRAVAVLVTGVLFAAVHAHLPSFAPLFILAVCLSLAYEWSGSLLVPMTMHSTFNALTMLALAFPQSVNP